MSDPARIDRVLLKLAALWRVNPDQRLGQLIANLSPAAAYIDDDEMEAEIVRVTEGGWEARRPECNDNSPSWFTGRWRDWHRGHGCNKDDGRPRTNDGAAEIARGGT